MCTMKLLCSLSNINSLPAYGKYFKLVFSLNKPSLFHSATRPTYIIFPCDGDSRKLLLSNHHHLSRTVLKFGTKPPSKKVEDRLRVKDSVPEGYELIYRAPMMYYIKGSQLVSSLSILAAVCILVYITIFEEMSLTDVSAPAKIGRFFTIENEIYLFVSFFLIANFVIYRCTYKYPFRIYKRNSSYILVKSNHIPMTELQLKFAAGNLKEYNSKLPLIISGYKLGNLGLIILEDYFRTPRDLTEMMSSQKDKK